MSIESSRRVTLNVQTKARDKYDPFTALAAIVCAQVSPVSDSVLETAFKQWDPRGSLLCGSRSSPSHHVHVVQTTGANARRETPARVPRAPDSRRRLRCRVGVPGPPRGDPGSASGNAPRHAARLERRCAPTQLFVYLLSANALSSSPWRVFSYGGFLDAYSGDSSGLADVENASRGAGANKRRVDPEGGEEKERKAGVSGVLNPAACFHLGDVILFSVDTHHYPLYDL